MIIRNEDGLGVMFNLVIDKFASIHKYGSIYAILESTIDALEIKFNIFSDSIIMNKIKNYISNFNIIEDMKSVDMNFDIFNHTYKILINAINSIDEVKNMDNYGDVIEYIKEYIEVLRVEMEYNDIVSLEYVHKEILNLIRSTMYNGEKYAKHSIIESLFNKSHIVSVSMGGK